MNVLATALQLFWVAEYDAAVHLAVPKVEAAARALLLACGADCCAEVPNPRRTRPR